MTVAVQYCPRNFINGELFNLYVKNELAPTLAKGDIVILDKSREPQRQKSWRNHSRQRGPSPLPAAYNPDLNPIEQIFAKLKHLMRTAEPCTIEVTRRKAGDLLDPLSRQECANYHKNSG
jgi:transposase